MHYRIFISILIGGIFFIFPNLTYPEFFKYIDENGNPCFVDDRSKIPLKYRKDIKTYQEKYDHLSSKEKELMLERDKERLEELIKRREATYKEFDKQQIEWSMKQKQKRELEARNRLLLQRKLEKKQKDKTIRQKNIQPIIQIGDSILVPVILGNNKNKLEVNLLLDTGASMVLLHSDIADKLDIKTVKMAKFQVANGDIITSRIGNLEYIKSGTAEKEDFEVSIIEHNGQPVPFKGLLGMNFLKHFEYQIDFKNGVIIWNP